MRIAEQNLIFQSIYSFRDNMILLKMRQASLKVKSGLTKRPKNGIRSSVKYDGFHHALVHPTLGILAPSQAFFYASAFSQSDGVPPPAPARVTQTVRRHAGLLKSGFASIFGRL